MGPHYFFENMSEHVFHSIKRKQNAKLNYKLTLMKDLAWLDRAA
jgi:hypothetical protein